MGIFTRFRDIVSSNINAMLDHAEDPEKLIKLMIHEMEDTLIEIKASCAGVMAGGKKVQRQLNDVRARIAYWEEKAGLAVNKGRDDLAREALIERRKHSERSEALDHELIEHNTLVDDYQRDIRQLEQKLASVREKQRMLVQRHVRANRKRRAQEDIRRVGNAEAMYRFDDLENRIERMESEAELVNYGVRSSLEEELDSLGINEEIEEDLKALKASQASTEGDAQGS